MFGVIISTGRSQLYVSLLNNAQGFWGNDFIAQSRLIYRTNRPSTNPLSKMGMCPGPSQKEHCISSVRDADTNVSPNWRLKDTVRLGWDFVGATAFSGVLDHGRFMVWTCCQVSWYYRKPERQKYMRMETDKRGQWHPDDLNCTLHTCCLDYSPNPGSLSYSQYTSILG